MRKVNLKTIRVIIDILAIQLQIKRKILSTLLTGIMTHKTDHILRRNGCLIVGLFRVPVDILFEYERLVKTCLVLLVIAIIFLPGPDIALYSGE